MCFLCSKRGYFNSNMNLKSCSPPVACFLLRVSCHNFVWNLQQRVWAGLNKNPSPAWKKGKTRHKSHTEWQSCGITPAHTSWDQSRVLASWHGHFCSIPTRRGRLSDGHCEEQTTASSMPAGRTHKQGKGLFCASRTMTAPFPTDRSLAKCFIFPF